MWYKCYCQRLVWTALPYLFSWARKLLMTSLSLAHCMLATVFWDDWFSTSMIKREGNQRDSLTLVTFKSTHLLFISPPSDLFFLPIACYFINLIKDSPWSLVRLFLNLTHWVIGFHSPFLWFSLCTLISCLWRNEHLGRLKWVMGWFDRSWHNSHKTT